MEIEQALCCKRIDLLEKIPKSNWHSHAGKGANIDFLNSEYNTFIPRSNLKFDSIEEMQRWFSKSRGSLNNTPGKMCKIWEGCFAEAKRDNYYSMVQSFSVESILDVGGLDSFIELMEYYKKKYCENILFFPELRVNRAKENYMEIENAKRLISSGYFRSIDLCGNESIPANNYVDLYKYAAKYGVILKAHVGEFGTIEDVANTIEQLNLSEIYHGIRVAESKELIELIKRRNIIIHVCPTSNVRLGRVKDYGVHPLRKLIDYEINVTINTDDLLIFDTSLSQEYLNLFLSNKYSVEELGRIWKYSISIAKERKMSK